VGYCILIGRFGVPNLPCGVERVLANTGWALIGLIILSIIGIFMAFVDYRKMKAEIKENP